MFDFRSSAAAIQQQHQADTAEFQFAQQRTFLIAKRMFDISFSLILLPFVLLVGLIFLAFNPFFNKGPLLFVQQRMGRGCRTFRALKFRTMTSAPLISRGPDDPLETARITPLGAFMRKSRLDELPQVINVLRGDMSLIGPRPDYIEHARHYLHTIPGYRARHAVRPGISGLAQTQLGYAHGIDATANKVRADLHYIQNSGFRLEGWIFWRTLVTVFGRHGD